MIKETELVTLNGDTTAFGGRIYNAQYSIGFNESASSVKLSIINESGEYNISKNDLSVLGSPDKIAFGGRELKMFPVEYSKEKSESGFILNVEYTDSSVIYLDKKFVVLNGTHVSSKSNSPSDALITVGQKYYSQELDAGDGVYVQNLVTTPPNVVDLGQSMYYVSELYEQMIAHGIPMDESVRNILLNKNGATDFLYNAVGTLRAVLMTWANLMAFAFYWGEDNKLHFIDLEENIDIDLSKLNGVTPFSEEETYSMKDTIDRGYSLYYGKAGNIQSEDQPPFVSSFFFKRGIQNYDSQTEVPDSTNCNLAMIKASLLGEEFFNGYVIYKAKNNNSVSAALGIEAGSIVSLTQEEKEYVDPDNVYVDYNFVKYKTVETKYNYGYFRYLADKLLTYEFAMNEDDFEEFSSWSQPFQYDLEDDTSFFNNSNGGIGERKHRAYFSVPFEAAFDLSGIDSIPNELIVPVDFQDSGEADGKGLGSEYTVVAGKSGVNWAIVESETILRYKYINKKKIAVRGYKPRPAGSVITPMVEKIYTQKPSYSSDVVSIDMQLDSTNDNEVALAGKSFDDIADILNESYVRAEKTFKKNFSITGIALPQNITPEDGLQSISISNTNERGTISTYTVGNTFFKIPSKEIILQKLEREKYAQLKANPIGNFNISFRYF